MKTKRLLKHSLILFSLLKAISGFSQDSFTAKDLSVNPIYDGTVVPTSIGFDATVSTSEPVISFVDGAMLVSSQANQTAVFVANSTTTQAFQPTGDYTIEYRVKVPVWNGGRGFDVYIRDGVNAHNFYCVTNERMYFNNTTVVSYYLDTKRYHTYRYAVTRATGDAYCWIDGVYKGKVSTIQAASGAYTFQFGKSSTANIIDFYLDYLTYDLTGAYKPTNTVLVEPDLTAKDIDASPSIDGSILPADAGWTLATLSGADYTISSTDGIIELICPVNNQYVFQSPTAATNNLYTFEFKAKVTAATGRGMDVVIGTQLLCLTNTKLYNNSDGGSTVSLFDVVDNNFHTFRFSGSGTGKYADVWIDNKYIGTTNVASASKFQLGKGNSSSATTLYLDYANIDNTGSYKPFTTPMAVLQTKLSPFTIHQNNGTLSIVGLQNGASNVRILNIKGQSVQLIKNYQNSTLIDISKLSKGIYFVQITGEKQSDTLKFIID